jgi:hypothetical protein
MILKDLLHPKFKLRFRYLEIAQLEQILDKYKLLKQGLMQELSTGKIRLV